MAPSLGIFTPSRDQHLHLTGIYRMRYKRRTWSNSEIRYIESESEKVCTTLSQDQGPWHLLLHTWIGRNQSVTREVQNCGTDKAKVTIYHLNFQANIWQYEYVESFLIISLNLTNLVYHLVLC